ANSSIVRASHDHHPDVFFALKGAAASFGIITEFVVQTHPEPTEVVQYSYNIILGSKAKVAQTFAQWQAIVADPNLSRKMASQFVVFSLGVVISGTYFGSKDEYRSLNFEGRLAKGAQVTVNVMNDWLGVVDHWAED